MNKIYSGPTGSGKTTKLLAQYRTIAHREGTGNCLTFVKSAREVGDWTDSISLEVMGPLPVFTYLGFVQKEIANFWPELVTGLPGSLQKVEPTFMNVETAHYIMTRFVEKKRAVGDVFDNIKATEPRIAVQLIDNLNQGAMNCLSLDQIKKRLLSWAGEDVQKREVFQQVIKIMTVFRSFCRKQGVIDYSLAVELFNNNLLSGQEYIANLGQRFPFLFVDDLEKSVPAAQDLFLQLLKHGKASFFTYNAEGGFNRFFGGNPELARENFFSCCEVEELKEVYTADPGARDLAQKLRAAILRETPLPAHDFIKGLLEEEYRGKMLQSVVKKIVALLEEGVLPGNVALIAPEIDKVVEFTVQYYLQEKGYEVYNLNDSRRLVDIPFTQALITLTLLVNRDWEQKITFSSLQQTFYLLLDVNPLQSSQLARRIFSEDLEFPEIEAGEYNFLSRKKYNFIKDWLTEKRGQELNLEALFQSVFRELLLPLSPGPEEIKACHRLIDSVVKFKRVVESFKELDQKRLGAHFIDMLQNGTLAAEVLFNEEDYSQEGGVVLATPYKFLYGDIDSVEYVFWLDISSKKWLKSLSKELANPYIFTPGWENNWDDELDQNLRYKQLVDYLQSILSKCTAGLFLVDSYLDSRGWEQEGRLYDWLQPVQKGNDKHD
ncbi:MAG: hypothetical protein ACOCQ1_00765 [Halanaerobiaceae bacterium]